MSFTASQLPLLGGRLSVDFVNATPPNAELSWERLIHFLESTDIVSAERGAQLLTLPQSDTQTAEALLLKSRRLGYALRKAFAALLRKQKMAREWIDPVNEILRITEGHDELVGQDGAWKIEFIAREGGLERSVLLRQFANAPPPLVLDGRLRQPQQSSRFRPQARLGTQHSLANRRFGASVFLHVYFTYFGDSPFDHGS